MTRNPENERYELERDLKLKRQPVRRAAEQAENPQRRKKAKRQRDSGEVPYTLTRKDRRGRRSS